jgi:hypothetical protein
MRSWGLSGLAISSRIPGGPTPGIAGAGRRPLRRSSRVGNGSRSGRGTPPWRWDDPTRSHLGSPRDECR